MKLRMLAGGAAVALLSGYWYWSPLLVIHNAREAAASGNRDKFAQYVDGAQMRGDWQRLARLVAAGRPPESMSTSGPARWDIERPTLDVVVASPDYQAEMPPQSRDRFVWQRVGFAGWKLTEIRPPGVN